MKKIVFVFILTLAVIAVNADEKENKTAIDTDNAATIVLAGSVTDVNSGESLVGVEVKLEGTDLKTYTDFDGNFTFSNVRPGEYKVVASYISYNSAMEMLEAGKNKNELELKLQPSK
jgi:hypothetical protein